jgi:hypothetical protein
MPERKRRSSPRVMYLTWVAPIGDALTKKAGLPAILAVLSHHLKNTRSTDFVRLRVLAAFSLPSRLARTDGDARKRLTSRDVIPDNRRPGKHRWKSASSRA